MKKILFLLSLLFVMLTTLQSQEIWLTERVDFDINENSKYKVEFETRYNDFVYYDHTDVGYSYYLLKDKNLSLNSNIRLVRDLSEYKLKTHFSFDYNFNGIGIKPRIEFNVINPSITYRVRLYVNAPIIIENFYVHSATEWFMTDKIDKYRVYFGLLYKISNVDLLAYYMNQTNNVEYITETHIIGISARFSF